MTSSDEPVEILWTLENRNTVNAHLRAYRQQPYHLTVEYGDVEDGVVPVTITGDDEVVKALISRLAKPAKAD